MPNFRKKPIVIQAEHFDGKDPEGDLLLMCLNRGSQPDGLLPTYHKETETLTVPTLEGDHTASKGDWIIKGIKGELYPCKPDIFEATYNHAFDLFDDSLCVGRCKCGALFALNCKCVK